MNSKLVLIITVILAVLILGGAVGYAVLSQTNPGLLAAATAPQIEQVSVPESLTQCHTGDRCIVVETTCSFCCKYMAINVAHVALFDQMYSHSCDTYRGDYCACTDLQGYPSCVEGRCQIVALDTPHSPVPAP